MIEINLAVEFDKDRKIFVYQGDNDRIVFDELPAGYDFYGSEITVYRDKKIFSKGNMVPECSKSDNTVFIGLEDIFKNSTDRKVTSVGCAFTNAYWSIPAELLENHDTIVISAPAIHKEEVDEFFQNLRIT